jgi:hypothetical protein
MPVSQFVLGSANWPTKAQRTALIAHRDEMTALLEQRPIDGNEYHKRTFGLIAKLILAKPARAGGPETTEARQEAYDIALDDVPHWAVQQAIRKWYRGECGAGYDYRWAPDSADLRKLARRESGEVYIRVRHLNNVLNAIQRMEIPEQERQANIEKITAMTRSLAESFSNDRAVAPS